MIFRHDRLTRGGGVLLAVHNSYSCYRLPSPSNLEVVTAVIGTRSPFLMCVVYIPPNSAYEHYLKIFAYLESVVVSHPHAIIVGDFNLPDICWSNLSGQSSESAALCDFVFRHNLLQVVDFPTHSHGSTLDLVLTNSHSLIENTRSFSSHSLKSDHLFLSFSISSPSRMVKAKYSPTFSFNYKKTNLEGLCSYLFDLNYDALLSSLDIEFVWSSLKDTILHAISLFTPSVKVRSQSYPKWFSSTIRHKLNILRSLRKKCKKNPSNDNTSRLHSAQLQLENEIHQARCTYESNLIKKFAYSNDPKIYHYLKSLSRSNSLPSTIHHGSVTATMKSDKAELFNKFFHSVFTTNYEHCSQDSPSFPNSSLCSIDISHDDTFTALASLDPSKAMGGDRIPPIILKHSASALLYPIHHLFTLCLSQSYLPAEWRSHYITPIPKSGDLSSVSNYRPISLLCCISKVLERVVFEKVCEFLMSSSISLRQFGFVRNRSTLQQLILYSEFLITARADRCQVDSVYLDIRKAFDTIPHDKLLSKLWNIGITGKLWLFFKAYLTNRRQCVVLEGHQSEWLPVTSGVPQGSILGPLLFLIYINEVPSLLSFSSALLYADDTKCFKRIQSSADCSLLQTDLNQLLLWIKQNCLSFNVSKCCLLRFPNNCTSPENCTYQLDNDPIASQNFCKDLGIMFSTDLSWSQHYQKITSHAYRQLGLIRRCFSPSIPVEVKKVLYTALVRSHLTYCSQVWRPRYINDFTTLERVQRRATKYILNDFSTNYRQRLISLELLPLMYFLELLDILFFIKCLKFPDPSFPVLNFVSFSNTKTRSSSFSKLIHNPCSSRLSQHSYFSRIARLWNTLPPIDTSVPFSTIKFQLKSFFWSHFLANFNSSLPCSFHVVCPCSKCSHLPVNCNFATHAAS